MVSPTKKRKSSGKTKEPSSSNLSQSSPQTSFYKSAFSPAGNFFAYVSLAVDKHRLRVYDTSTGRAVAEHTLPHPVSSIAWAQSSQDGGDEGEAEESSRKKRKRRKSGTETTAVASAIQSLALGLSNGSIIIFSPTRGRIVATLSHPSNTSPILAIATSPDPAIRTIWTSCADSTLRAWDPQSSSILQTWTTEDRVPSTSLSLHPGFSEKDDSQANVLSAHHNIRLLLVARNPEEDTDQATEIAAFPGHASAITTLIWLPDGLRFLSSSESDRVVCLWEVPPAGTSRGKMVASIALDSDCRQVDICSTPDAVEALAVSASGTVSIFALPSFETAKLNETKKKKHKREIVTLSPNSTINISITTSSAETQASEAAIIAAQALSDTPGLINVVRLIGVRPVFERLKYIDEDGSYIPEVNVIHKSISTTLDEIDDSSLIPNHRYAEREGVVLKSGVELGEDQDLDNAIQELDGELDVELAELSLGQRLKASGSTLTPGTGEITQASSSVAKLVPVPATSLTRTLTQALHSSDSQLLETCLVHSDSKVVKDTVRNLPPQLAIPLLNALTERLGRGGRKRGGGASTQKGGALVVWLRAVLILHTSYLMTIPDLVSRLAALHATLTSRSVIQERLLALNGRLDLVLSQIEMKTAPGPSHTRVYKKQNHRKNLTRYVEGESSEEDAQMDVEPNGIVPEVDSGDEDGSIQDIELGDGSEDDTETDEETDGDDEKDSDDDGSNGFIDDEAEENWEEDESDESDE